MKIGVPREIKVEEYRVGITPAGARELVSAGHKVSVEAGAGEGSGFTDDEYRSSGAEVVTRDSVFRSSDLIVKVKEPVEPEYGLIRSGQAIFTYLHLAPNPDLLRVLLEKRVTGIAYETVEESGKLPLLMPMSEIAGRMAPLVGAYFLGKSSGGRGVLPTGVPGVPPARALVLGAGVAGTAAARVCIGLGMEVFVVNKGVEKLRNLDNLFPGRLTTAAATQQVIEDEAPRSDLIIGAVLVPGARAPRLVTRSLLARLRRGTVIVDISVDQGGCVETTRPTTHADPVYEVEGVIHYAVANMPGAYPRTSTLALTNMTLPYVRRIADRGLEWVGSSQFDMKNGLNVFDGRIVHPALAEGLDASA